jgi:hypothetical protein
MKIVFTLKDLVKYIIFIGIVYTLIIKISSQNISTMDLILIVSIISIGFIVINCLSNSDSFTNINDVTEVAQTTQTPQSDKTTQEPQVDQITQLIKQDYSSILSKVYDEINKSNITNSVEEVTNKNNNNMEMEKNMFNLQNKIKQLESKSNDEINKSNITNSVEEVTNKNNNNIEMEKIMFNLQNKIKQLESKSNIAHSIKYMNLLITDLLERGILDNNDIENIKGKINTKLLTEDEAIVGLEKLKLSGKTKQKTPDTNENNQPEYSFGNLPKEYSFGNMPPEMYKPLGNSDLNKWDDQGYTMLNTDKWQLPMARPPVCINTSPCKVCPDTNNTYPVPLAQWNNSRKVSNIEISKEWANTQVDPKENLV